MTERRHTPADGSLSVWMADTPPSYNAFRYAHWRQQARLKKTWQTDVERLLMGRSLPRPAAFIIVDAVLTFPTDRARDEGNFRVLLEKVCGDALVNGGWLRDDTWECYEFGSIEFTEPGARRTALRFRWWSA